MADRVITAEAIINAKDNTGDAFASIARKMQGVAKAAKTSVDMEGLTKNLEGQLKHLKAMEAFAKNQKGFGEARAEYRQRQAALDAMAKTMRGMDAPTKEAVRQLNQLRSSVSQAWGAMQKQGTVLKDAKHALEAFGAPLTNLGRQQDQAKQKVEALTGAIHNQVAAEHKAAAAHVLAEKAAERRAHHGIVNYALSGAAGYASAHGIMRGVERSVELGSEYNSAIVALRNAGRTPEDIRRMQAASSQTAMAAPTSDYIENLKVLNETTGAFGSVEHAMEHLTFMQKAATVLHATAGDKISDTPGELGNKLARFFEMRGTAGNGELFQKEASEMMRAMVFSGGNFNPGEMLNFAQQAKSSLQNYSLDFLSKIAPSLIGEVGGERAGTQANAFTSVLLGKINDQKQAEAWAKYGLVDPKQMTMKAGHAVGWTGGAVYGTNEALQNPYQWGLDRVLPALAAHGVDINDRLELTKVLGTLYRNSNANAFANELWQAQNRQRLEKDRGLIGQVDNPNSIYGRLLGSDSRVALKALQASTRDLLITLSSPLMPQAAKGMSSLSYGLQNVANFMKDNPAMATASGLATAGAALGSAGYLSYQLSQGFGLGRAATSLSAAAERLSGSGGLRTAEHLAENGVLRAGIGSAVITVGQLAIAGVAAVAVIDALSNGKKKTVAGQQPGFGEPFGPGSGATMPSLALPGAKPAGAGAAFGGLDQRRPSNAVGAGHWVYGRGGYKQWVSDAGHVTTGRAGSTGWIEDQPVAPLKIVPFFASGYTDAKGDPVDSVGGAMGFIGRSYGRGKNRRLAMTPYGSIPSNGFGDAPMPNFGPDRPFGPMPRGPIDITGKVQVDGSFEGNLRVSFAPSEWLVAKIENITEVLKLNNRPSVGITMEHLAPPSIKPFGRGGH